MFGLSVGEIFFLGVIALLVIGPKQLPEFARQVGRVLNEIKRATGDFAEEMKQQARIDLDSPFNRASDTQPPVENPVADTNPPDYHNYPHPDTAATIPPNTVSAAPYAQHIAVEGSEHGEAPSNHDFQSQHVAAGEHLPSSAESPIDPYTQQSATDTSLTQATSNETGKKDSQS